MNLTATARTFHPALATKTMLALAFFLALTMASQSAFAQTYNVLYNFTGQSDGGNPTAGVTLDHAGNLYGTTSAGGSANCSGYGFTGCGTVFKLSHRGGGWTLGLLHKFTSIPDGANPEARVIFGPNGALFGTTSYGGTGEGPGYGTVFQLQPPANFCPTPSCPWLETQLYSFQNINGPTNPGAGHLVFDSQGNVYGTTPEGDCCFCGQGECGGVFELSPNGGGGWDLSASVFQGGVSRSPIAGLVLSDSGLFYGTTSELPGGLFFADGGLAHRVHVLHFLVSSPAIGGLILDSAGDLFGTTSQGGTGGGGTVFEYSLNLTTLYNFAGPNQPGSGPTATLLMDASGNLYGITQIDGAYQQGSVFKLSESNGVWTLTTLHDFTGGADGGQPFGQLTMDASGNLYGTTSVGGNTVGSCYQNLGCGVVFEITP